MANITYVDTFPETGQGTINISSGNVLLFDMVGDSQEVTLLRIDNTSTAGQTMYLGFGVHAVIGIFPLAVGFSWVESIDSEARPFNGQIYILSASDGATYSIHRRTRVKQ